MSEKIPTIPGKERFNTIYTSTFDKLYHFIQKNTSDKSSVKDIMQECYVRLWENLEQVTDDETVIALLRKYAINLIINALHKHQKELQRQQQFYTLQPLTDHADEQLHAKELIEKYQAALAELPAKRRKVFILKREKGLSHKQIADQLGISVFTIDRHMNEAIHALREKLSPELLTLVIIISSGKWGAN